MNPELCKNCEHTFQGNFCSNCGQKTNTVRLNWHFVVDELKYTFLHINKGLLYSCKQLLIRPGDTVREFLEGKRVKHYKPILLVVVLAGLNGLLMHFIPLDDVLKQSIQSSSNVDKSKFINFMSKFMDWLIKNYAFVELGLVPFFSLCSWLAFRKFGYNYIENVIINCFGSAQRLLAGLLFFPIEYLTLHTSFFSTATSISTFIGYGLTIWLYFQLFKNFKIGSIMLRMLLFIFNVAIMVLVLILFIGVLFALLLKSGFIDKSIVPI